MTNPGIEDLLLSLLSSELCDLADAELGSLTIDRESLPGTEVSFSPRNPHAASVSIYAENGDRTFYVGTGQMVSFEIPLRGRRYTKLLTGTEELVRVVQAVKRGNFVEHVWCKRERVVRSTCRIEVAGRQIHLVYYCPSNPFIRARKQSYRYEPW